MEIKRELKNRIAKQQNIKGVNDWDDLLCAHMVGETPETIDYYIDLLLDAYIQELYDRGEI